MKGLILFAVICIPIVIIFMKLRREKRMRPLAEVLDERRFKIKGIMTTTMSGLYQGRPTRFYYSPGGGGGQYGGSPAEFHVVLSCRSLFSFKIYKESMGSKVGKALGFVPDVEIGDPELDRQLVFRCDSPQSFTDWVGRPEVKEKVASLVLAEGVDSLQYDDGFLGVYYVRGGFYIGPIALGSSLKEEMTPWNVTFVLQKLQPLTQSLESIM